MNKEKVEKQKSFIVSVVFYAMVLGIAYVVLKYALGWFTPFIIGYLIAYMLKPLINILEKRLPLKRRVIASIVVLFAYTAVGMLLWVLGGKFVSAIGGVIKNLPDIFKLNIVPVFEQVNVFIVNTVKKLMPDLVDTDLVTQVDTVTKEIISQLSMSIGSFSKNFVSSIGSLTSSVPKMFLTLLFSILSSIFITMDYNTISSFLYKQLPVKFRGYLSDFKGYMINTALKYFQAYMKIMGITFVELCIGLSILQIDNPIGVSAIIAICDVLPLIGCGTVLIPWLIVELIRGNYTLAIGLSVVYIVIYIIRNIIEPRIVGKQLGLHPLVTLVTMYLGLQLFGFGGMIILPVITIILINFQQAGTIKLWKE